MTPDQGNPPPFAGSPALQQLRDRYRASSPELVAVFRGLAAALAHDPAARSAIDDLCQAAHRLRGTAGSYGFSQVSELAGALEAQATKWRTAPGLEREVRSAAVLQFVEALEVAFASG